MAFSESFQFADRVQTQLHPYTPGTKMNDLIERIVNAMIMQEGAAMDALNPGNLRAAPWRKNPEINQHNFWVPSSRLEGLAGLAHLVALHIAEGQTLRQFISGYAPSSDNNNTEAYIANVLKWAGIPDENVALWNYL